MGLFQLFKPKKEADPDRIQEFWKSDLNNKKKCRFALGDNSSYSAECTRKGLMLHLKKSGLFAWDEMLEYTYDDFVLNGQVSLDPQNGYSAAGFIFRQVNHDNFYYFMVSSKGYFRFEAVFNGSPITLIPWTKYNGNLSSQFNLRVIAHLHYFIFIIDENWVAEISAEYFRSGGLAFAGQNFDQRNTAFMTLTSFSVDSRPMQMEAHYSHWIEDVLPPIENRLFFARSLARGGQNVPAIYQYRKAVEEHKLSQDDLMLFLQMLMDQGFYKEGILVVDRLLKEELTRAACIEKGHLLYLTNQYTELKDHLTRYRDVCWEDHRYWNLLGHAEYSAGNNASAAKAYEEAFTRNPEIPLYGLNAARSWDRIGDKENAIRLYGQSSIVFFQQEVWDDLEAILGRMKALDPDNWQTQSLESKMEFHHGQWEKAEKLLDQLLNKETGDSTIPYLKGILLNQKEKRKEALAYFEKARELQPEYPLYAFKVAEARNLLGLECEKQLDEALTLNPEDQWVLNLAGQIKKDGKYFEKAYKKGSLEPQIVQNYSAYLAMEGRISEAINSLLPFSENGGCVNQLGNIYVSLQEYDSALKQYEKAIQLEPANREFLGNGISAALAADSYGLSEEFLKKLLDLGPWYMAFVWAGRIAARIGDYPRAVLAYKEALSLEPKSKEAKMGLGLLYMGRLKYKEAKALLQEVIELDSQDEMAHNYLERIRQLTETSLECGECGLEWWIPKERGEEPALKIKGELPEDVPAGACPQCKTVYCIGCAMPTLDEGRFHCKTCGTSLKLQDSALRYIIRTRIEELG